MKNCEFLNLKNIIFSDKHHVTHATNQTDKHKQMICLFTIHYVTHFCDFGSLCDEQKTKEEDTIWTTALFTVYQVIKMWILCNLCFFIKSISIRPPSSLPTGKLYTPLVVILSLFLRYFAG